MDDFLRLLTLQDYNTRVVMISTGLLGLASGLVGTFLVLRKRALMSDAVSHATLPGVALAFLWSVHAGGSGRSLPVLLGGAAFTGVLGMMAVLGIRRFTRLKDDAALGIVLSLFFGAGIALLGIVQQVEGAESAGLKGFIYGKTASLLFNDFLLIAGLAALISAICGLFYKEFKLLCFDQHFAATLGWPVFLFDFALMSLIVLTTVIGLQSVGLILVVSLLIIPPAAARFWSHDLKKVLLIAGALGMVSGFVGSGLSAVFAHLPAGAVIVLSAAGLFLVSILCGPAGGILPRVLAHRSLSRRIGEQNLLRTAWELGEGEEHRPFTLEEVLRERSWSRRQLRGLIRQALRDGHLERLSRHRYRLTGLGEENARRVVRNHRLWELYLIHHAEIAPSHVDRDADQIEHVLDEEMIDQLEGLLSEEQRGTPVSPH